MKKTFTLAIASILAIGAQAQLAKKYVLFEHFTQASCGPCAAQNPGFQSSILNYYGEDVHHVAYHTSWPGVDPMNAHNKPQVQSRVTYYGVSGVPNIQMDGSDKGGPGNVSQQMVANEQAKGSPISVAVTQTIVDDTVFNTSVTITTVGTKPSGSFKLLTGLIEGEVVYSTPPGSNGEKDFPNVFRKMASSDDGDDFTMPEQGQSITLTYSTVRSTVWVMENMYSLAAVQGEDMSILNSGSSKDSPVVITYGILGEPSKTLAEGTIGTPKTFTLSIKNTGSTAENYKVGFTSSQPANWSATLDVNGTAVSTESTINVPAGTEFTGTVTVTPGSTAAVASYTVTLQSVDNPNTIAQTKTIEVISGVRDLVINNTANAGSKNTADFNTFYLSGITSAGNNVNAASNSDFLGRAFTEGALSGVKSIYFNIGWSFGALTDDMVANLKSFIDNGGNLFIAGQDLAWESCDATSPYFSQTAKDFINQYLHAGYGADAGGNTSLVGINGEYFSSTGTSAISNSFYGAASSSFYPDDVTALNGGVPIFKYGNGKFAGIRHANTPSNGKIVYMAIGPEQLTDNAKKEQILKISHDYFYSTNVGINETKANNVAVLGDCYPNPAGKGFVTFTFGNLKNDAELKIVDVTGKMVYNQPVWKEVTETKVNTDNLNSGIYFYQLVDETGILSTKKLTVTK